MLEPRSRSEIRSFPKERKALLEDVPDYPWDGQPNCCLLKICWFLMPIQTNGVVCLEAGRKAQTSEQHCLVLPRSEHEQQQQDLGATCGLISPEDPEESHMDREQVSRGGGGMQSNLMSSGPFKSIRSDNKDVGKSVFTSAKNFHLREPF